MTLFDDFTAAGQSVLNDFEARFEAVKAERDGLQGSIGQIELQRDQLLARIAELEEQLETGTTPEPEPEPEPTNGGAVAPGTVGFLGDRTKLTRLSGQTITKAGTVIENALVTGDLVVAAENVTIRKSLIQGGYYGIRELGKAKGLTIEDVTVSSGSECSVAIQSDNVTVRRVDLSGGDDGMKVGGKNITLEDIYIHDLLASAGAHNDGIQFGSASNVMIRRSRIEARNTSCIAMFEGQGTWSDITIEDCYLSGAGYLLYAGGRSSKNIRVRRTVFDRWGWGPVTGWNSSFEWTENTTADGTSVRP